MIALPESPLGDLPGQRVFSAPLQSPDGSCTDDSIRLVPLADLDLATETGARAELEEACEARGTYRWVVVHGEPEWFVDVRGLAVLLDGAAQADRRGRELVVVAPPSSLRQSVGALGLGDRLRLIDDVTELAS
jgi:anti-anti-sigma regulatory factor